MQNSQLDLNPNFSKSNHPDMSSGSSSFYSGFTATFTSLQELFPQVDPRLLRAVAIEHSEDVEAAVDCIISEVLPSICSSPKAPHTTTDGENKHISICNSEPPQDVGQVSPQIESDEPKQLLEHCESVAKEIADDLEIESLGFIQNEHIGHDCSSTFVREENSGSSLLNAHDRDHSDQLCVNVEPEAQNSPLEHQENVLSGSHQGAHASSDANMMLDDVFSGCNNILPENMLDLIESEENLTNLSSEIPPATNLNYLGENIGFVNCVSHDPEEAPVHGINQDMTCLEQQFNSLSCETLNVSTANEMKDASVQLDSSDILENTQECVTNVSTSKTNSASDTVSEKVTGDTKLADSEDKCFSEAVVNQSTQKSKIDVLDDAVNEAKNNKKTLFTALDSVIQMMREVEDLEKAAEHAKEEALRGGLDIYAKVEDLRKMLQRAKEANDMHAGEVYGEKAILATEARELQSRLQNLSYERDRSLSILNEMHLALEARIAAAEDIRKAAEQDKLKKEESARKALMDQELVMERVVQESKRLKNEAEENSKFHEFLMDRGLIVDKLQGEMAVICKDVDSLKENFENQVPVSKILTSGHTSCILASSGSTSRSLSSSRTSSSLASSGSSSKSLKPYVVPQQVDPSESPKISSTSTHSDNTLGNGTNDDDWNLIEADVVN